VLPAELHPQIECLLDDLAHWAELAHARGLPAVAAAETPTMHPRLRELCRQAAAGRSLNDLAVQLQAHLNVLGDTYAARQRRWSLAARYTPTLGIPLAATTMLLVLLFGAPAGVNQLRAVLAAGTILTAAFLFHHLAQGRKQILADQCGRELLAQTLILQTLRGLLAHESPRVIQDRLRGCLNPAGGESAAQVVSVA